MFSLFIRSANIRTDSRLGKYFSALDMHGIAYRVVYWDRSNEGGECSERDFRFRRSGAYGLRYRNILNLIAWNFYLVRVLIRNRKSISFVHAVDLDTGLGSILICKIFGIPFVYDVYDCYSDSRGIDGSKKIIVDWIERAVIKSSNLAILADPSRFRQIKIPSDYERMIIVENVPNDLHIEEAGSLGNSKETLRLGYLGNLEAENRGLEDLLRFCIGEPLVELHVGGLGALTNLFHEAAQECSRIHFYGAMTHKDGLSMMKSCDLIVGLYYLKAANHKFAAPNKYYEHLLLGKPILTSRGTPPGERVVKFETGWAIDDGFQHISQILSYILKNPSQLVVRGQNARGIWDRKYSNYFLNIVAGKYASICQGFSGRETK